MNIELTENETKRFEDWKKSFEPLPDLGTTGGHFGLKIVFTSIGQIVIAINWKDEELLLSEEIIDKF